MSKSPFIIAFDCDSMEAATALADRLDPQLCRAKVGKELFTACGMQVVSMLHDRGYDVFLDLKFHDIPNTVAKAVAVAAKAGVWMVNVHASGGEKMMSAARQAVDDSGSQTLLIAVTVLTSMDSADLAMLGLSRTIDEQVAALAAKAQQLKLDGVVCSAREADMLRKNLGSNFVLVTPGIRPEGSALDDQSRTLTPAQALSAGSDYLVVGRPVTRADDPLAALQALVSQLPA